MFRIANSKKNECVLTVQILCLLISDRVSAEQEVEELPVRSAEAGCPMPDDQEDGLYAVQVLAEYQCEISLVWRNYIKMTAT